MRTAVLKAAVLFLLSAFVIFVPSPLSAQSATTGAIAGEVRDATGLALPGVAVEAASPALIEKARTVVTDAQADTRSPSCGRAFTR